MQPVVVGWAVQGQPKHYLITRLEMGMYFGWVVDRTSQSMSTIVGQLENEIALNALLVQGVSVDSSCGCCDYTIREVFKRLKWKESIIDDEAERQNSKRH